jgi:ribonuclease-3
MPASALDLAERLNLSLADPALLSRALVHSSYTNEHPDEAAASNERLEFLGDSVLSLLISEVVYARHPDEPEGLLTARRAAIVSTRGLARVAQRLDLGDAIVVGQGAERTGERRRSSVLAGAFEAIVAAVYLDGGLDAARRFVLAAVQPELEAVLSPDALKAPKSRLQERSFAASGRPPSYRIVSAEGPDHDRHFVVEVSVGDQVMGRGEGRSRREAETEAALVALLGLAEQGSGEDVAGEPGMGAGVPGTGAGVPPAASARP